MSGEKKVKTPFPKLKLTVTGVSELVYHGYKIGDEIYLEVFTIPLNIFAWACACAFPRPYTLEFWSPVRLSR
jgi:hypothetical protein